MASWRVWGPSVRARKRLETEALGPLGPLAGAKASDHLNPSVLAARIKTVQQEPDTQAKIEELKSLMAIGKALEQHDSLQAGEVAKAENDRRIARIDELHAEVAQLKLAGEDLLNRYRPVSRLALLALPLAAIGEAAALYGVANDDHATIITVLVSVGILLGGLLLLGPLFIGWLKLLGPYSWIRRWP